MAGVEGDGCSKMGVPCRSVVLKIPMYICGKWFSGLCLRMLSLCSLVAVLKGKSYFLYSFLCF